MQHANIGPWEIEYDREATKAAYARMGQDGYCECKSCRNYLANLPFLPEETRQFFDHFGIDPAKPYEISSAVPPPPWEGPLNYQPVWYYCVGQFVSGPESKFCIMDDRYIVCENFEIAFSRQCNWPCEEIPKEQALQLSISIVLPWRLEETYNE